MTPDRNLRPLVMGTLVVLSLWGITSAQAPQPARVDRPRLLEDLRVLAADDMQGRELGTAGGDKARAYVLQRFRSAGLQPLGTSYEHPFTATTRTRGGQSAERHGVNVVGVINGTAAHNRYIVISAHYDHVGMRRGQVFNGADDNASGTAALFELARYYRAHPPSTSLLFVAFDGEEEGLLGSRAFVRAPPVPVSSLLVDLNADMIGRDPDNVLFVVGLARHPALKPFIDRVASRAPVKLRIGHEPPFGRGEDDWTEDSDQYAFIEAGIPGLYFGVEDYAHHHQPTDDFETMTYDFYVRSVETLIDVIEEFDRGAEALASTRAAATISR
ncbi:MAG: M28 family peptidase [Vicinamibacterales bacterium]